MQCKVDGCDRAAHYKAAQLCQMHYFRQWRYGTTDTVKRGKAKPRQESPQGYQWVYQPGHPLAHGNGYVAEHRAVVYADLGEGPLACELCGMALTWGICHVDHIDNDVRNNARSNLRPTCRACNTQRGRKPEWEYSNLPIEYAGEIKTAAEWARDPRVSLSGSAIRRRMHMGMSPEAALFSPKVTHNGKPRTDNRPRKTQAKHERANAVAITINGETKTAAEWSREPGVTVTEAGIIWRIKHGWAPDVAVFKKGRFACKELEGKA